MRRAVLLLSSVVLAVAAGAPAAPAWAHTRLVSSTPSAGAQVHALREVVLAFSDGVRPALSVISVTDEDGRELAVGEPSAGGDGSSVVQALRSPTRTGTHRVAYRVVAADGHPVSSSFEVTVTTAVALPGSSPAATAASTPAAAPRPSAASDDVGPPVVRLVLGGLVVAGAVVALVARRSRSRPRA